jgi:hypothetical protein
MEKAFRVLCAPSPEDFFVYTTKYWYVVVEMPTLLHNRKDLTFTVCVGLTALFR